MFNILATYIPVEKLKAPKGKVVVVIIAVIIVEVVVLKISGISDTRQTECFKTKFEEFKCSTCTTICFTELKF